MDDLSIGILWDVGHNFDSTGTLHAALLSERIGNGPIYFEPLPIYRESHGPVAVRGPGALPLTPPTGA